MDVVILAAGLGKRMGGNLPKALVSVGGKPMVTHVLSAVMRSGVCQSPIVVVGHCGELVRDTLGNAVRYAVQTKQRGTADAVRAAKTLISKEHVLILYGDHPNIQTNTIKKITSKHLASGATLTMATVTVNDFDGERAGFLRFGRILRNNKRKISRVVEYKDATEDERAITELNPSYFCVQREWLFGALSRVRDINAQREFYLTDIVGLAVDDSVTIETVPIAWQEALGANTPEELSILERLMQKN